MRIAELASLTKGNGVVAPTSPMRSAGRNGIMSPGISTHCEPFSLRNSIPKRLNVTGPRELVYEIDMIRFPPAARLVPWANFCAATHHEYAGNPSPRCTARPTHGRAAPSAAPAPHSPTRAPTPS